MNVVLVSHRARERRGPSSGYDFPRAKVFLIRFRWNTARSEAREDDSGAHEQSAEDAAEILSLSLSLSQVVFFLRVILCG